MTIVLWIVVMLGGVFALIMAAAALQPGDEKEKTSCWIAAGIGAAIASGAWLFIPETEPAASSRESDTVSRKASANRRQGEKTLAYWTGMKSIVANMSAMPRQSADVTVRFINNTIANLDRLPAAGVDAEAIECAAAIRSLLSAAVLKVQWENSTEFLVEAFLRGSNGDFAGPILEQSQNDVRFRERAAEVQTHCANARAVLSARYDVEFPAF